MNKHETKNPAKKTAWGPLEAVLITVAVFMSAQILAGIFVIIYGSLRGWSSIEANEWLDTTGGHFWVLFTAEILTLGLLALYLKHRKGTPKQLGLREFRLTDALVAVAGFGAYFLLLIVTMILAGLLIPGLDFDQKQELGFSTSSTTALLPVFITLVILPPLVEEILFRGFLYTGLRTKFEKVPAALITSIMFATPHLQFGSGNPLLWTAFIDTFLLSMVSIYLFDKTKGLWASIGLHMIKNGWAFVALFVLR